MDVENRWAASTTSRNRLIGIPRSDAMKYMIMTFGSAEEGLATMGREWMPEMIKFMTTLDEDLKKASEYLSGDGLADRSQAKTVTLVNGIYVATDRPFAESDESLVRYLIVEVESI